MSLACANGASPTFRTQRAALTLEVLAAPLLERELTPRGRSAGARRSAPGIAEELSDPVGSLAVEEHEYVKDHGSRLGTDVHSLRLQSYPLRSNLTTRFGEQENVRSARRACPLVPLERE